MRRWWSSITTNYLHTGTASYHIAKYLAKMLSPLSRWECTANNSLEFVNYMKTKSIPLDEKLILFNVKLLFMNVLFDFTTDLILSRKKKL